VFLFTLLMVSREGLETALLLMQLRETLNLALGAAAGVSQPLASRGSGRDTAGASISDSFSRRPPCSCSSSSCSW
jgi:hypothetical protein